MRTLFMTSGVGKYYAKTFFIRGYPYWPSSNKQLPDDLHHAIGNTALAEIADNLISVEQADIAHIAHTMRVGALAQALKP
jgi:hypothetical protein